VKVLRKVQVTTLPYRCSCSSKYLVIFETAVYCRRVVWFHVFLYKTNEWRWWCWNRVGRYLINAMDRRNLINAKLHT